MSGVEAAREGRSRTDFDWFDARLSTWAMKRGERGVNALFDRGGAEMPSA